MRKSSREKVCQRKKEKRQNCFFETAIERGTK